MQNIIDARRSLQEFEPVTQVKCSSFYVSSPVGYANQNDFVNCVFQVNTNTDAERLFLEMQRIEDELGRVRDVDNQNGPRTVDLDLLLFEQDAIHDVDLTVPHPRLHERLFVIWPLLELAPMLNIPNLGSLKELLQVGTRNDDFNGQVVHRLGA